MFAFAFRAADAAAVPALRLVEAFDFAAWYAANAERLLRLARRHCGRDDAEDLAQAVALRVLQRGGPDAALYLMVRHVAGHRARAAAARRTREEAAAAERPEAAADEPPDETVELITARVADRRDRAVAALLSEGRNGREVAEVLGVSQASVSRAVARLAAVLA